MLNWLKKIKHTALSNLNKYRFLRFLIVGFGNTVFAFSIYTALIISGVPVFSALLAAWLCGTLFNFFSTGGLVFKDLSASRFPRFVISYIFLILLNYKCISLLTIFFADVIIVQAILSIPLAILSYFVMARFVFHKSVKP